ncbi:MAG TPA: STAS domain-containing protein [Thermomicrobiaceae bacterium]|nr:STAS domain-containing protein [Thermomicrobiaceae bacterium]
MTAGESDPSTGRHRDAEVIARQRHTITELETPVIQVWDGILALPLIGSVDTARAQQMNETLLERIVETGSEIVILDITGVPVVDTAVAKHLLETVAAARLLGAEVLIVGLSTRTALTLVQLGLDLAGVTTRTTMAKGLELAFARLGLQVVRGPVAAAPVREL